MRLETLELTAFRSYEHVRVAFAPGVNVLVGRNAHGKTNLLEAAYRLAVGSSHRVSSDVPLVRRGEDAGYVRATVASDDGRTRTVDVELRPGRGRRARVDGSEVTRAADAVGVLRAVIVAPEDLSIIRGDPGERRRFLDDLLAQRRPAHAAARAEYERTLRQRNQLLRSARGIDRPLPTLDVWTEQLIAHGAALTAARIAAVSALAGPVGDVYAQLTEEEVEIALTYRSSTGLHVAGTDAHLPTSEELASVVRAALEESVRDERKRGMTLVGPHRDDLEIELAGLPARGYASHGQLWSLALALRIAAGEVLAEVGDRPVVLLDDVFAELDELRRGRLAGLCSRWDQVIVSTAVEGAVPVDGARFDVVMNAGSSIVTERSGR